MESAEITKECPRRVARVNSFGHSGAVIQLDWRISSGVTSVIWVDRMYFMTSCWEYHSRKHPRRRPLRQFVPLFFRQLDHRLPNTHTAQARAVTPIFCGFNGRVPSVTLSRQIEGNRKQ